MNLDKIKLYHIDSSGISTKSKTINKPDLKIKYSGERYPLPLAQSNNDETLIFKNLEKIFLESLNPRCNNLFSLPSELSENSSFLYPLNTSLGELVFEITRLKAFNFLPSRLSCIFLTDAESLPYWFTQVGCKNACILEVLIDKFHLFKADPNWLTTKGCIKTMFSNSFEYWSGKPYNKKAPLWEYMTLPPLNINKVLSHEEIIAQFGKKLFDFEETPRKTFYIKS